MNRQLLIVHLVITYASALNGYFFILYPKCMTDVCLTLINQYSSTFILFLKMFPLICMRIRVMLASISYGCIQRKTDEIESNVIVIHEEQQPIVEIVPDFLPCVNDLCEPTTSEIVVVPEVSVIEDNDLCNDNVPKIVPQEPLLCYCDGSYSSQKKIAYSGFRASDGFSEFSICPVSRPRSGSTESEVFAACLALRYATDHHYNSMILHTDNSKVEQLFKSPKLTDYIDYPDFFEALTQYRQKGNHVDIQVKRVRGHTTRYEQQKCAAKRAFAKVDRQVRQKLRQHIRRIFPSYPRTNFYYRYTTKNTRNVHTMNVGTTFMMISVPKILSYC